MLLEYTKVGTHFYVDSTIKLKPEENMLYSPQNKF